MNWDQLLWQAADDKAASAESEKAPEVRLSKPARCTHFWGLGVRVEGIGFRVYGLGRRVGCLGFRVYGWGGLGVSREQGNIPIWGLYSLIPH